MEGGLADQRRAIPVVPPAVHASVGHLPGPSSAGAGEDLPAVLSVLSGDRAPFWRPGVLDVCRAIGWGWVLLGPCAVMVVLPLVGLVVPWSGAFLVVLSLWHVWIVALGGVISLSVWGVGRAVRERPAPFCVHCGFDLRASAARGLCPECGRAYIPGICEEYRKDPAFFRQRVRALRSLPREGGGGGG